MNNKILTFLLCFFCVVSLFSCEGCSNNPLTGGSDMPNFINVSVNNNLLEITPSEMGFVQIFSSSFNPLDSTGFFTSVFSLSKDSSFQISLPKGEFNIFVTDSSRQRGSFTKSLPIGSPEPISFSDTLDTFGSIEGSVVGVFDSSKIFIPGSFFIGSIESNNRFSFSNIPQGTYTVAVRVYRSENDSQFVADLLLNNIDFVVRPSQLTRQDSILISSEEPPLENGGETDNATLNLVHFAHTDPRTHAYVVVEGTHIVAATINTVYSFSSQMEVITSATYETPLYKLSQTDNGHLLITFASSVQLANPQTLEEVASFSENGLLFLNSFQAMDDSILIFAERNDSLLMYKSSSMLENSYFASYITLVPNPIFDVEVGDYEGGIIVSINTPVNGESFSRNELFVVSSLGGGYEISPFVLSDTTNISGINRITHGLNNSLLISGSAMTQETNQHHPILVKLAGEGVTEILFTNSVGFVAICAVELSFGGYGIICSRPGHNEYSLIIVDQSGNIVAQKYFFSIFSGRPSISEVTPGNILVALPGTLSVYNISFQP